jgi:hypothetical protein
MEPLPECHNLQEEEQTHSSAYRGDTESRRALNTFFRQGTYDLNVKENALDKLETWSEMQHTSLNVLS